MSTVNKHLSIPKNVSSNDDMDFDFLRKKGIEHIESLGSKFWTDYNVHDPGITILEVLCYAITDLGMRINLPIENLLTTDITNPYENQFFKAAEILPSKPVTVYDYRKLIVDIDPQRIKNCWLQTTTKKLYVNCKEGKISLNKDDFSATLNTFIKETEIKGYYTIVVDFQITKEDENEGEDVLITQANKWEEIKTKIIEKFHENRNLCEDLLEVNQVENHPIAVCTVIDIDPKADEELVYAQILSKLEHYLSPAIEFESLEKMSEKYFSDEIFEGPLLNNGFIDTQKLIDSSLRTEVRLSDIMNILMQVDGVKVIKDIAINNCDAIDTEGNVWNICIPANKKPTLCQKSTFNFTKGVLPVNINKKKVNDHLSDLKKESDIAQKKASENKEIEIPKGKITNSSFYRSITNDFPETYGIGESGLSDFASYERKAQAKQLKGYLLFFDQILASYFKHLSTVKELLSVNSTESKTFFTQLIKEDDFKGFDELVTNYGTSEEALTKNLFGHLHDSVKKQNELKDHLIARFAERFSEYTFLMKTLYGKASDEIILQNKSDFLATYDTTSSKRACSFTYYNEPARNLWNTFNVTGLENRIAGLLGIKGDVNPSTGKKGIKRKNLSKLFVHIYDPTPATPATNFRWRIRNSQNKIVLSATEDYASESEAANEMYFSLLKLYETSEKEIEEGFKMIENEMLSNPFKDTVINTIEVIISDSGKYSFHIINPEFELDLDNPDRIIARQYKLYATLEEVKNAILSTMKFFKEEFSDEGLFLVEHLLLVPDASETTDENYYMPICADDCAEDCCIPDPYSFKISVVLPGYTYRFSNIDFRNYAEDLIRQEIPSHILGKICWIGYRKNHKITVDNDLVDFEKDFKNFLIDKSTSQQSHLPKFIKSLSKLNSIYPTGTLYNCKDETENISGKIILGRTNLGTI